MPRSLVDDFLDGLREVATEFVTDFVEDRFTPIIPPSPREPRPRGAPIKGAKAKTPKTPKPAKRERVAPSAYEILEVSPNASPETITAAFRSLAKRFHPDGKSGAEAKRCEMRMILLNLAYEKLADPKRRREYDAKLKAEAK